MNYRRGMNSAIKRVIVGAVQPLKPIVNKPTRTHCLLLIQADSSLMAIDTARFAHEELESLLLVSLVPVYLYFNIHFISLKAIELKIC